MSCDCFQRRWHQLCTISTRTAENCAASVCASSCRLAYLCLHDSILPLDDLIKGTPFSFDVIHMQPVCGELEPVPFQHLLSAVKHVDLGLPLLQLPLESLYECDELNSLWRRGSINWVIFQICTRLGGEENGVNKCCETIETGKRNGSPWRQQCRSPACSVPVDYQIYQQSPCASSHTWGLPWTGPEERRWEDFHQSTRCKRVCAHTFP